MVWFKVDDNMPDHQKVRGIPRGQRCAAVGLWTLAGAWCSRHLKDGQLPAHMVEELAGKGTLARLLVDAGLWHESGHDCPKCPEIPPGSYLFHDWRGSNPTRKKVEEKREADRERLRKWRDKQASNSVSNGVGNTAPDPTRPDPTRSTSESDLNGDRYVPLRVVDATEPPDEEERPAGKAPVCARHPNGNPEDKPCRGCQKVEERRARDGDRAAEAARRDAEARARACTRCDGVKVIDPDTKLPTKQPCDHTRRTA